MQRGITGHYEIASTYGERVNAFVPYPLPPAPPIALDGELLESLVAATLALGRLDAVSTQLPDKALFIYMYVRKEALLSSQIEGTQSSMSELLQFELEKVPGVLTDDVVEVSNYVAALDHGISRLRDDFPLSNRLVREIHGVLLSSGRGSDKMPGEFRRSQNWIGGTRPGNARYVPPPHIYVDDCMGALESFLHMKSDGIPPLLRAGLAHVQFETIHPFLDGNGRIGRLLITFLLHHAGVLREPTLYLSLYLKKHRDMYYELLDEVRMTGDWESWLLFFFDGVRETAENAFSTTERISRMFDVHRSLIDERVQRARSVARVHDQFIARPVLSIPEISKRVEISYPTASSAIDTLMELGIAQEITGASTNRLFAYQDYLSILSEGTEME